MIVIARPVKHYCCTCGVRRLMLYVISGHILTLRCLTCKAEQPERWRTAA